MENKQDLTPEEILWKIYETTEKTRKYILWGRVMSFIYIFLIVAPMILAIIYLPPLLSNIVGPYKELLGSDPKTQKILNNIPTASDGTVDVNKLLQMYQQ
ncbi:MAG TPA: hypothetical protein PLH37_00930 [bacterium]|nr:hypothetical protein [bacterium]